MNAEDVCVSDHQDLNLYESWDFCLFHFLLCVLYFLIIIYEKLKINKESY
jgi:hypothetical protein